MGTYRIITGDCREVLKTLVDCSADSIVTDPPYGLEFMGKSWDMLSDVKRANRGTQPARKRPHGESGASQKFQLPAPAFDLSVTAARQMQEWHYSWAVECLRVLKPGGHLLAFGGSRTYHRLACAIEDAGFEIRDQIQWIYGSGFPKSLDVSKAIDNAAGATRIVIGQRDTVSGAGRNDGTAFRDDNYQWERVIPVTAPVTDEAKQWNGWGTALKPAHEPIVMARKPLIGTVAENVLQHGTGGLNIDGCRIEGEPTHGSGSAFPTNGTMGNFRGETRVGVPNLINAQGRWPANVIHDGSEEVLAAFPESNGGAWPASGARFGYSGGERQQNGERTETDNGSAARFFYCAKASVEDREDGCDDLPHRVADTDHKRPRTELDDPRRAGVTPRQNNHPTVKPTDLMRHLCRLVTPPGGTVLDPFCGSGSTGRGATLEGFHFIGIDANAEYCEIAERRINAVTRQGLLMFA